jgi:hypothetical protein
LNLQHQDAVLQCLGELLAAMQQGYWLSPDQKRLNDKVNEIVSHALALSNAASHNKTHAQKEEE